MARLWTVVLLTTAVRAIPAGGRRALLLRGGGDTPNDTFAPYAQLFKQSGASPDADASEPRRAFLATSRAWSKACCAS